MNKSYKWIGVIVFLALVIFGVSLIGSKNKPKNQSTITIGGLFPFTGVSASFGERAKHGMELALEKVNSEYPFELKVIYEDDKGESAAAVAAARKLMDIDRVNIIIGTAKSDPMLAVAPITEADKVILFTPIAGAAAISQAGDYVFRNLEVPAAHGKGSTAFLKSKGVTRVALFTAQASNAQSYGKAFRDHTEQAGVAIVYSAEYPSTENDFRTNILKAKQENIDAFYLAVATGKDSGIATKQIRESGFADTIMASVASESQEFLDSAGSAAEGVFVSSATFNPNDPVAKGYTEQFRVRYGKESDGFAANAYDAVILTAKSIEHCKNDTNTDCIRDYLYNVKDYPGVGGKTTFDQNGDVIKPVQIKEVKNGKFVSIELR